MDDFFFMYVGIGVCIVFRFGGNFLKGLFKFGFNRLDIIIFFLFFLFLVDIFLFWVWILFFFIVSGWLIYKDKEVEKILLCVGF